MTNLILPPSTIGIIGGGQLGRMMAISAKQMGYKVAVLEPAALGPLAQVADLEINAPYDSEEALTQLLAVSDVVTYEFENIDSHVVEKLASAGYIPQGYRPLAITQHRYIEKTSINNCGFKTAPFEKVDNFNDLKNAIKKIGYPSILKTVSGGYDGKVGEFLRLGDVDDQVLFVYVFTYYLTCIHFILRINEELTAVLKLVDGISEGCTAFHGNHGTVATAFDVTLVGLVFLEAVCHDGFSL